MRTTSISQKKRFGAALVVTAPYMSNPGINGSAELAIRNTSRNLQIWSWDDQNPAECVEKLPAWATWRDALRVIAHNEMLNAPIVFSEVTWRGSPIYQCQLFAAAWIDSYDLNSAALLLSKFDDSTLENLSKHWPNHLYAAVEVANLLRDEEVEESDIPDDIHLDQTEITSMTAALQAEIGRLVDERSAENLEFEELERVRAAALEPFKDAIDRMVTRWIKDHPYIRGGGMSVPPVGLRYLKKHIEAFVIDHHRLPRGIRQVRGGGPDGLGRMCGGFSVDFDALQQECD
jgi:hypothetical protein